MTRRITDLADPSWWSLFTEIGESWFRLETLQQYDVDYEASGFAEFQRTGRVGGGDPEWQELVRDHASHGRSLRRVHLVREPLTDYLRYELAIYALNNAAGEDIRILPASESLPSSLRGASDFWILDDREVWAIQYDHAGRFVAADGTSDPALLARCQQQRDDALRSSMPIAEYRAQAA